MIPSFTLLSAYLLDRMIGDPRWLPHPVVWMGKGIVQLQSAIRKMFKHDKDLQMAGILLPLIIAGGSFVLLHTLLDGAEWISPWLSWGLEVWLISTTIAVKGLAQAGNEIFQWLKAGNLVEARRSLAMVVGRDTESLDEKEISRGAVETVAENLVDAVIAPLFYAAIGGAPLAMAYRAINTLDSMVGYKNERYRHLGWASARLDDLANYLPARLTALFLVVACYLLRLDWRGAWRVMRRDARLHPSPNSGIPEAGVAGALGIRLGGINYYQGVVSERAYMGDALRSIVPEDIKKTVQIMQTTSLLFLVVCMSFLA